MIIDYASFGPFDTNAYLIACSKTRLAAAIDAPMGSASWYQEKCTQLNLKLSALWLTHSHWDHTFDAADIKKKFNIPLLIHPEDNQNLEDPGSDKLPLFQTVIPVKADQLLRDGMLLTIGDLKAIVIETPGHTPGCVCFYFEEEKILFSGDTLFKGSIGNLSFSTARPKKMWLSLKKLAKLPIATIVYPGHGEPTTIERENWLDRAEDIFS